jgi:hypothetical protein
MLKSYELFNIYYGMFYELWTFAYFDRLCKLEKGGKKLKIIFSSEIIKPISTKLCWNDPWVVPFENCVCLYSSNLGTFWLKIEQFWPFEEISIFSHGGHLGYRTALTDTILKGDHPRIISAKISMSRSTYPAILK